MISIICGFVVFWVLARKLKLSKSIVPAVAIGLSVFILCVHLTLPPENNLRVLLGGSLEPWILLVSIFLVVYFYREILRRIRSISTKNTKENLPINTSEVNFSDIELERYSRHVIMREIGGSGQKKLKSTSILVVGAGGLGSPVLQYLSAAGIGKIGIIDDDVVDQSNLQRQIIHNDNSIGVPKVFSAQKAIKEQNPHVVVKPYNRRLNQDIANELLSEYDIIIEGSDNFETRYLVNEVAKSLSKVVISGALSQWEGQIMVFDHAINSPCYECVFPEKPADDLAPTCAEAGVFSALPGVVGTLMAAEAIKHILDIGNGLRGVMLIYDAIQSEIRIIKLNKATSCRICADGKTDKTPNPLLGNWETPHKIAPFDIINDEHFEPALAIACSEALKEIDAIISTNDEPTFENTIEALLKKGRLLDQVVSTFYTVTGAHTNEKRDQLLLVFSAKLSDYNNKIYSNSELFKRIARVVDTNKVQSLNKEQVRVLMLVHRNFLRSGAALMEEDKARFQSINKKLAEIGTKFSQNLLNDERDWFLKLERETLETLPSFLVQALKQAGKDRGINQAVLTLSRSLITPFLQFCPDRELRELAYVAWTNRGASVGDRNNVKLAHKTLKLRAEMAKILGFESYSHYKLETEMASSPEAVDKLLTTVWAPAREAAIKDETILTSMLLEDGINDTLKAWDWRFYAERRRLLEYDLNEENIKPFFQLDNLINAIFKCAYKLFELDFAALDVPLYHEDCRAWTVSRKGVDIAVFIGDYFARPSKRSGAWCSAMRSQARFPNQQIPIVINVCNFSKLENTVLSFDDAKTLFHEFGHALHQILSDVTYDIISGTSVARDFVELPSQLFEHWLEVPEILEEFATHCDTGEPLAPEMLSAILKASTFDMGFQTTEYLASAFVDLYLHLHEPPDDIMKRQDQILQKLKIPAAIGMRHAVPHFAHVFSGSGYASGYYSYMWSEVMEADAFSAFTEVNDPFDSTVAKSLEKNILAAGGSEEPEILYVNFRGRLPDPNAMIEARGLYT